MKRSRKTIGNECCGKANPSMTDYHLEYCPRQSRTNGVKETECDQHDNLCDASFCAGALPASRSVSESNFTWGELDGKSFSNLIDTAHSEVVHWRRNLFLVPSGRAGKAFVTELARLWESYANASALELIALRAATVCASTTEAICRIKGA